MDKTKESESLHWSEVLFTVLFMVGVLVAVFWAGTKTRRLTADNEGLVVAEESRNFGEVWQKNAFPWTLAIENRGADDVEIMNFGSPCSCVRFEPPSLLIPHGQTAEVKLTLDLTSQAPQPLQGETYGFAVQITPHIRNGLALQTGWTLRGRVRRALTLSAYALEFGETLTEGQPSPSRPVTIIGLVPLSRINVKCNGTLFKTTESSICNDTVSISDASQKRRRLPALLRSVANQCLFFCGTQ